MFWSLECSFFREKYSRARWARRARRHRGRRGSGLELHTLLAHDRARPVGPHLHAHRFQRLEVPIVVLADQRVRAPILELDQAALGAEVAIGQLHPAHWICLLQSAGIRGMKFIIGFRSMQTAIVEATDKAPHSP